VASNKLEENEPKVALVTGASRGIGRAIALRLAADGFLVAGTATADSGAAAITEALGDRGQGYVLRGDAPDSVDACLEAVVEAQGAPLVLVNNAGITRDNLLLRLGEREWRDVIETNLGLVYRMSRGVLRGMMKARFGRIINISSVVGRMGNPGQTNYAATKAGIEGFTRALAQEVASRNITVNAVAPGFIGTDMTGELDEAQTRKMLERIPLNRMGSVDDVAHAVAFLASEQAGYITGETLNVNGGLYMA
jgi:3-oxoacyl-[acyl-carrier protein] reductase